MLPTSGIALAGEIETLTACPPVSCVLIALDSDCWITSVGANWVPPPKENGIGVAWRDQADQHADGAGLDGPIHLQAHRAGAAVDQRDLAGRIVQDTDPPGCPAPILPPGNPAR